jgi:hypothetical protein
VSYSGSYPESCRGSYPENYGENYSPGNPESCGGSYRESYSAGSSPSCWEDSSGDNPGSNWGSNSEDYPPDYWAGYSGDSNSGPVWRTTAATGLLQLDDLADSVCLSLRLRFPHKVHPRRQRPHVIRTGTSAR